MTERAQRRLAAIVSADVAGYSRLMGADEEGTLIRLRKLRSELVDPAIVQQGGRIVKTMGDGLLLEFPSVVEAVRCMLDVQASIATRNRSLPEASRILLRVGVNQGDIIVEGDDIFGDGVNVAARLQEVASLGGICISGSVHEEVRGRIDARFEDGDEQQLKNIARPVRVWRWSPDDEHSPRSNMRDVPPPIPEKPSIAVLPFANMSGDPEQEYFTDGVSEDIITELSRFRSLFVIARTSSFTYKGKLLDVRIAAKELGVRYILEGSIRKAADRIRVTGQLIDALTGNHIWSERYDRVLDDIFAVQEELTRSIVRAIAPQIQAAEIDKARRRRPESLGAYEIAVRAWAKAWEAQTKADRMLRDEAIAGAKAALTIDTRSNLALNALAFAHWQNINLGLADDPAASWDEAIAAATRAIEADPSDCTGYATKGLLLAFAPDRDRAEDALIHSRNAHDLNPHSMLALNALALIEIFVGNPERAIVHLQQALRSSPRDPLRYQMHTRLAVANILSAQYDEGVRYALLGIAEAPEVPMLHAHLAIGYVGLGQIDKARAALNEARRLGPEFVDRVLAGDLSFRKPEHRQRATKFLRVAAGLELPNGKSIP